MKYLDHDEQWYPYHGPRAGTGTPLGWTKTRRGARLSVDPFDGGWADDLIDRAFAIMALCPQHTFQVLTAHPERMREYLTAPFRVGDEIAEAVRRINAERMSEVEHWAADHDVPAWPLPNVWLGVKVGNQAEADERIPHLLDTPAALRFVVYEPTGAVDFLYLQPVDPPTEIDAINGTHGVLRPHGGTCAKLDWIIIQGQTGRKAKPCDVDWFRSVVEQCKAAEVPCFVRGLGSHPFCGKYEHALGLREATAYTARCSMDVHHPKGADPSEWPEDLRRVRQFPKGMEVQP
ncbi:DUF5131 family protein [Engelhardtia mirabilis]|uniref:Phage protein Gp37/Gp68 n=1 Tax=Engelhardtia mirabilis TaxID=2528011 RepID=A0A518BL18_9BACT|nr:Phage protein Gp37/Gp68 [Planctomycetes bacterium Pla133]QDV02000.1 Phage protein Gp37/Gp68 [Planctomycetes bacterium Pla86]